MSLLVKFRWFLAPSIFQAGISFATLPVATLVLGPEDYGAFAVVAAIVGLASAIACLGSSYLLAQVFSGGDTVAIRQVVSKQLLASLGLAGFLAIVLMSAWGLIVDLFPNLAAIPTDGFFLLALSIAPATLWAIALDVLTLDGQERAFAKIVIGQSLLNVLVLMACLFWLRLGTLSLFISAFASSLVLGVGAFAILSRYWDRTALAGGYMSIFRHSLSLTGANTIEVMYQPIERSLIAANSGLVTLGLYTHAQQYRTIVAVATKALARTVWSVTLDEARVLGSEFPRTNLYWRLTYLALTLVGLGFASLGDEFIGLLTHGKFVGAGPFAAMGIVYLLVQNAGKAHTGFMYAHGHVGAYARCSILASTACLVCAFLSIPMLGVWGALLSLFAQQVVLRTSIQVYVSKIQSIPFQDAWLLVGTTLILLLVVLNVTFNPGVEFRVAYAVFAGSTLVVAYMLVSRRNRDGTNNVKE